MEASAGKIMIPITDLRIGNWFLGGWLGESYLQVVPAYISAWSGESGNFPPPKPIPLTPIILEKCEFKNDFGENWKFEIGDSYIKGSFIISYSFSRHDETAFQISQSSGGDNCTWIYPPMPKYLHELQNAVYFGLGYEINYTP